jgi:hypothetical protein
MGARRLTSSRRLSEQEAGERKLSGIGEFGYMVQQGDRVDFTGQVAPHDAGVANGTTRAIVSGVLALIAFFLGGAAAGASALWHRANDGMVNGVVTWAVTVIALLGIALVGGGALVGSLADTATQFVNLRAAGAGVDIAEATRTAQQTAGATAFGLGLSHARRRPGRLDRRQVVARPGHRDAHNR